MMGTLLRFIPAHAGNTHSLQSPNTPNAVHPRACGEHGLHALHLIDQVGSSPRMRGTRWRGHWAATSKRFIPAHAGNTMGGAADKASKDGSSPRMRGTRAIIRSCIAINRFIPAHAGNTAHQCLALDLTPVHPRACGEHGTFHRIAARGGGSSPRMRGTRQLTIDRRQLNRFIPAHAGNTSTGYAIRSALPGSSPRMRGTQRLGSWGRCTRRFIPAHAGNTWIRACVDIRHAVHPRACGEHGMRKSSGIGASGSSPRMRGTHLNTVARSGMSRFIPAHAGNTIIEPSSAPAPTVHPRACGEHVGGSPAFDPASGSSPRMRGTQIDKNSGSTIIRFIPAHAGNTRSATMSQSTPTVHPRACGEHAFMAWSCGLTIGSSPRMRGTPDWINPFITFSRFIPAHAGNTYVVRHQRSG